jgi:hypothetical protein
MYVEAPLLPPRRRSQPAFCCVMIMKLVSVSWVNRSVTRGRVFHSRAWFDGKALVLMAG